MQLNPETQGDLSLLFLSHHSALSIRCLRVPAPSPVLPHTVEGTGTMTGLVGSLLQCHIEWGRVIAPQRSMGHSTPAGTHCVGGELALGQPSLHLALPDPGKSQSQQQIHRRGADSCLGASHFD